MRAAAPATKAMNLAASSLSRFFPIPPLARNIKKIWSAFKQAKTGLIKGENGR